MRLHSTTYTDELGLASQGIGKSSSSSCDSRAFSSATERKSLACDANLN